MIYTDGVHLISEASIDELHAFAANIGLKRAWFQERPPGRFHYDLTTPRALQPTVHAGALQVELSEIVEALHRAPQYVKWARDREKQRVPRSFD